MNNENQNSTKSVEIATFHKENLQETENDVTFAIKKDMTLGMTPEEVEALPSEYNKNNKTNSKKQTETNNTHYK